MGWNAVLALESVPDERFGRTYVDHLRALADSAIDAPLLPDEVRRAARLLLDDPAAGPRDVVALRTPRHDEHMLEAAEIILAEAYTRIVRRSAEAQAAR